MWDSTKALVSWLFSNYWIACLLLQVLKTCFPWPVDRHLRHRLKLFLLLILLTWNFFYYIFNYSGVFHLHSHWLIMLSEIYLSISSVSCRLSYQILRHFKLLLQLIFHMGRTAHHSVSLEDLRWEIISVVRRQSCLMNVRDVAHRLGKATKSW